MTTKTRNTNRTTKHVKTHTTEVLLKRSVHSTIALFLICLIVSMPLLSAQAYAEFDITVEKYSGSEQIEGVLSARNDNLSIQAAITYGVPEGVDPLFDESDLHIVFDSKEELADECEEVSDFEYTCSYESASEDRQPDAYDVLMKLYYNSLVVDQEELTVYIDGEAPTITTFSVPAMVTGEFSIDYEFKDTACTSCDFCAGLEHYELLVNNQITSSVRIASGISGVYDANEPECNYEETIDTSITALSLAQGSSEMCVRVYDRLNQSSESCTTIQVDTSAPTVSTFLFFDAEGNTFDYIGDEPIEAMALANISDQGLGLNTTSVVANFSKLNSIIPEYYEEYEPASCTKISSTTYTCIWEEIMVDSVSGTLPVVIEASDLAGNTASITKNVKLTYDNTKPIVTAITSSNDQYFNRENNTITFEITEAGAGFDKKLVYADFGDIDKGTSVQADECSKAASTWYCSWKEMSITSSASDGLKVDIEVASVTDDVLNTYDPSKSVESTEFTVDVTAPEVLNITISPVGKDLEVLTEDDVAEIIAYLKEETSGITKDTVFADFSDFDDNEQLTQAQTCEEVEEEEGESGIYKCTWEYTGSYETKDVTLNVIATDSAGNKRDSTENNIYGTATVVELEQKDVDYWYDDADVEDVAPLNPNFIRQAQAGTIVRLDTELKPTSSFNPYIHSYDILSCTGSVDLPGTENDVEATTLPINSQYYYPNQDKESKYVLINVPPLLSNIPFNQTVDTNGGTLTIICTAEVMQAKSATGNIYSPNEQVNITVTVTLLSGLFTEPSLTTVDKIQKMEKAINTLTKITDVLKYWVEWGTKICGPINAVRSTINNIGIMITSIGVLAGCKLPTGQTVPNPLPTCAPITGAAEIMDSISSFIDWVWKGAAAKNPENHAIGSPYSYFSLGYACDTVLCQNCGKLWRDDILKVDSGGTTPGKGLHGLENLLNSGLGYAYQAGGGLGSLGSGDKDTTKTAGTDTKQAPTPEVGEEMIYLGGEAQPALGGEAVSVALDPKQNLVIATICSPPCITGIYGRLMVYRQILLAYNVCLNTAVLKGEDVGQCDEFLSAQVCQQVIGAWFWHWIPSLITLTLSKMVVYGTEKALESALACPNGRGESTGCKVYRSIDAIAVFITSAKDLYDTWKYFNATFADWSSGNDTEDQEEMQEDFDSYLESQTGSAPAYG